LPSLAARELGIITDQFRIYAGSAGGNRLLGLFHKIDGTTAPTVNEDAGDGFSVGSTWEDTTNDKGYLCLDSTIGAAVWQQISGSGTYQPLDATLTAFAALTIAANSLTIGTGADAFSQTTFAANTFPARASTGNLIAKTITDAGLALVAAADVAAETALLNAVVGDSGSGGTKGLVPAPAAGDAAAGKVLGAGGGWVVPGSGTVTSVSLTTTGGIAGSVTNPTTTPAVTITGIDCGRWS
jgi:hypothetical protein